MDLVADLEAPAVEGIKLLRVGTDLQTAVLPPVDAPLGVVGVQLLQQDRVLLLRVQRVRIPGLVDQRIGTPAQQTAHVALQTAQLQNLIQL